MSNSAKYIELNSENFVSEVIHSDIPVLVDFWAVWCGPCRMMNPIIDSIAENWSEKIKVGKANVDNNDAIATEYNIQAIPTILIFHRGKVVERIPGLVSQSVLESKLTQITDNICTV